MNADMLKYLILGLVGLMAVLGIVYYFVYQKMMTKETRYVAGLVEGTKEKAFSMEVFYQKFYIRIVKIPFLRRYTLKIRRRLEIINLEDEYLTRKQVAQIMLKGILIFTVVAVAIILLLNSNMVLMLSVLLFEVFFLETIIEGMVDKIDNKLLKEQIDFFAEIRHAYHEFNMVEEAIYDVAQNDELEVSAQAEKIYEVLISDDPETELEKYYDIAPNSFLKEFAGISYLTREFGDRKDKDGASLYLKNLNNITQEMQIEILKREKLDYVFQSLSMISALPILFIDVVKNWAVGQFGFTSQFYNGTLGFYAQVGLIIVTFICYMLTRKLKDNGNVNAAKNMENPWQQKVYKIKICKKIVDYFIPKDGTREYRRITTLLKDSASKLKIQWLYVNRLTCCLVAFIISIVIFWTAHVLAVNYIYNEPTADYNLLGSMTDKQRASAMEVTEADNKIIEKLIDKPHPTQDDVLKEVQKSEFYADDLDEEQEEVAERVLEKLETVQSEHFQWFELLMSFVIAWLGYQANVWLMIFLKKMRQMEMENEVMQFQTIILMLMKIERVNVEMILEWLERYSNIFREPISRCVNNFESGGWEALEEMKEDISFKQLLRIIESLQAAVEKIPIREAFDELDTERAYYQEKRKETNEIMISKKSIIGKVVGFAPMVTLFVAYLIVPLCVIGLISMTKAFDEMSQQMNG